MKLFTDWNGELNSGLDCTLNRTLQGLSSEETEGRSTLLRNESQLQGLTGVGGSIRAILIPAVHRFDSKGLRRTRPGLHGMYRGLSGLFRFPAAHAVSTQRVGQSWVRGERSPDCPDTMRIRILITPISLILLRGGCTYYSSAVKIFQKNSDFKRQMAVNT